MSVDVSHACFTQITGGCLSPKKGLVDVLRMLTFILRPRGLLGKEAPGRPLTMKHPFMAPERGAWLRNAVSVGSEGVQLR